MARVAVVLSVLVVAALVDCSPVEPRVPEDVAAGAESTPSLGVDAVLPEAIVPEATVLEATVPEATVPEATVLEASVPEATIPEADVPGAAEPKAAEPKAAEPKAAEPEAAEPKAAEPEAAEPEAAVPLNVTPEDAVAQIERESNSGPVVKQPEAPVDVIEGSSKFAEKETTYVSGAAENEEILPVAPEDEFSSTQISDEPLSENDFPLAVGDEFQDYPVDSEPTIDDQDFVLIVPDDEEVSDLGNPESEPTEIDIAKILANADPNNNLITGSDPLPEAPIEDAIDPDFMIEQPDSVNSDGGDLLIDTAQLESSNNEEEISEQAPNEASIVVDETPVPDEPVMVIGVSGNDRPEPVAAPPSYDDYDQGMPDYSNNGPFVPPMVSDDYPIYDNGVPFMNEGPIVVPEPDYIDTPIHEDGMVFGVNGGETSYPPTNEENDGAVMDETNPSDETPNIFILKLYVRRPEAPPRRPLRL